MDSLLKPGDLELEARIARLKLVFFDFDGVFTDNHVYVFEDGREAVRCSRADGLGLRRLERAGIEPLVLSTEVNPVVANRCRKLGVICHTGLDDKASVMEALLAERGLGLDCAGYLGNDVNDLACLERVGFPAVVLDAHEDVLGAAVYRTRRPGGQGAVREVCDLIAGVLERGGRTSR
jgi:YrbI family 3-deoxy-D-manno-octulosonate 8-phosphate phosphatase